MSGLALHHTIYIRARPVELWAALTEAEQTPKWFLGTRIESSFEPGAPLLGFAARERDADTRVESARGIVREVEPARSLAYSFAFVDLEGAQTELRWTISEPASGVGVVRLDVEHRGFVDQGEAWERARAGWPLILSCLKTWLETREPLAITSP